MVDDAASRVIPVGSSAPGAAIGRPADSSASLWCVRAPSLVRKKAAGSRLPPQRRYRRAATAGAVERTGAVATRTGLRGV